MIEFGVILLAASVIVLLLPTKPRRRKVEPPPESPTSDIHIKAVYGMSPTQWNRLSDKQRAEKRENVALYFNQENQ